MGQKNRSIDNLQEFIPKSETRFVVLGTMASCCARYLNETSPKNEAFYYHDKRNRFWKVIQGVLEPEKEFDLITTQDKKEFLERNGVAVMNLVQEIAVDKIKKLNSSDSFIFECGDEDLKYKEASPAFKKLLETKPIFFTCKSKKNLDRIVLGFLKKNKITNESVRAKINYLNSPTRRATSYLVALWNLEINNNFSIDKILNNAS